MTIMTGTVERMSTKDVTTKFGVKPTYSLMVDGAWIKHGFKKPACNTGDEIQFDGISGTYGIEAKDLVVTKKGAGGAVPIASVGTSPSHSYAGGRVFPIPPLHGDRSIVRQNALARATDITIAARGGKPFEISDELTTLIIVIARHFEAYTAGDLDLAEANAEIAAEKAPVEVRTA